MGYICNSSGREIVNMIESCNIDTAELVFPQGSYDAFKMSVDEGVYAFNDYDRQELRADPEEDRLINKAIAEGKIFQIY